MINEHKGECRSAPPCPTPKGRADAVRAGNPHALRRWDCPRSSTAFPKMESYEEST